MFVKTLKIISLLIIILILSSVIINCQGNSGRTDLSFGTLEIGSGDYQDTSPAIYVLTDIQYHLPEWVHNKPTWEDTVDYSDYFVVWALFGHSSTSDETILITNIWQDDDVIYVRAQFLRIPVAIFPAESSPQCIVKVSKDKIRQYGSITFKLLDDYGTERASTHALISK
jgi:hypothetical protein